MYPKIFVLSGAQSGICILDFLRLYKTQEGESGQRAFLYRTLWGKTPYRRQQPISAKWDIYANLLVRGLVTHEKKYREIESIVKNNVCPCVARRTCHETNL